jgi:hypothetical protein
MPHKHTRRKGNSDAANFDLAPSEFAKPLPAYNSASKSKKTQNGNRKRKAGEIHSSYKHDDTPRAFTRMMQLQSAKKRQRPARDEEEPDKGRSNKRRKKIEQPAIASAQEELQHQETAKTEAPKILPGERLADFAARVDQALPVGGLKRKGKVKVEGMKERQTKTEKRLQKMYAAWRVEDARRKEKLEEQEELEEEARDDMETSLGGQSLRFTELDKKGKERTKATGGRGAQDEDPWAELKAKREQRRGLHDVVQAPPTFNAVPKEKFKVRNGAKVDVADVPAAAGSLKRREELSGARKEVIERYRNMMKRD